MEDHFWDVYTPKNLAIVALCLLGMVGIMWLFTPLIGILVITIGILLWY